MKTSIDDIFSIEHILREWTTGNSLKSTVLTEVVNVVLDAVYGTYGDGKKTEINCLQLIQIEGCDYFDLFTDYELTSEIYRKYCYEIEQILKRTNKEKNRCVQQYWRTKYIDDEETYSRLAVQFVTQWYVKILLKYIEGIPVTVQQDNNDNTK